MKQREPLFLRMHTWALALYPRMFRTAYREQLTIAAGNWYAHCVQAGTLAQCRLQLSGDLLISLGHEHLTNIRRQIMRKPLVFHAGTLLLLFTLLGGAAALTTQQMLRRGADEPQEQMVDLYASQIAGGAPPEEVIPRAHIDVASSLEPFLVFYDDQERPVHANGFLNEGAPTPPPGVFAHVRRYGRDKLTWQPQHGVRIAMVALRVAGAHPGFLLAGRSLRTVEEYEGSFWWMALAGWIAVACLLMAGAFVLSRSASFQDAAV